MTHEPNVTLFPTKPRYRYRLTPFGWFWLGYFLFLIFVGATYWWLARG